MSKGKFIVFEGGEGSGKSTILNLVYGELVKMGVKCIVTREPGGIKISEDIRTVILDVDNTSMDPRTEALLYAAARRQHLVEKVIGAIEEGTIVLCDRFVLSSLAYQGYARGLGIEEVYEINKFAIDKQMPDLNIFFDIDPKQGLARIAKNSSREQNRLDLEHLDFHNKVRAGYSELLNDNRFNIKKIDASNSIEVVLKDVMKLIKEII